MENVLPDLVGIPPETVAVAELVGELIRLHEIAVDRIGTTPAQSVVFAFTCGDRYGDLEIDSEGNIIAVTPSLTGPRDWRVRNDAEEIVSTLIAVRRIVYAANDRGSV